MKVKFIFNRLVVSILLIFASHVLLANDGVKKLPPPVIDNIGFMKNPPKELTEKFPMCDAFLKVQWIDEKKRIGIAHYDVFSSDGKKIPPRVTALIDLDNDGYLPRYDYAVSKYLQEEEGTDARYHYSPRGKLQVLFEFIRQGVIDRADSGLRIVNGKKAISFTSLSDVRSVDQHVVPVSDGDLLSGSRMNVCVPYPGNQRMWIAEFRKLESYYGKNEIDQLYERLKKDVPQVFTPTSREETGIMQNFVFDLNFDGIDDYMIDGLVYSVGSKYYVMEPFWVRGKDNDYDKWRFPHSGAVCNIKFLNGFYLTTDGTHYFLSNQCNLTDLTKEK